ncbi:MAG: hypothetical protein IJX78_07935 [Bacilli bacterium]|nr:hypothetical protein [Bacilli bacterium]
MNILEKSGITNPEVIVTLTILGIFIGTILMVLIVKFILVCKKQIKVNKKLKGIKTEIYVPIFGGADNIVRVEVQLNRVLIEVKDTALVNISDLQALNVGTQITGNIVKCSSKEMADELSQYKK